jgi:hypothetical protein
MFISNFRLILVASFVALVLLNPLGAKADGVATEATKVTAELGISILRESSADADFAVPASTLSGDLRVEKNLDISFEIR